MLHENYKIKASVLAIVLSLLLQYPVFAQNTKSEINNSGFIENMNNSFTNFKDSVSGNFNNFQQQQQQAFEDFKKQIQKKWGSGNFAYSDSVNWVEYYKDNNARSTVNFKEGTATIQLLQTPEDAENSQKTVKDITEAIHELVLTKGKTDNFEDDNTVPEELSNEAVLKDQLTTNEGIPVTEENINTYTSEIIKTKDIKKTHITGTDGESRVMVSVSIPLAPDYLKVRAEKILPLVTKYANKYNIEPELILGVIHIESYFNPKAISHANAIGLMQLVPTSGGMDSYKYVYGESKQPSRRFLSNPENNINLGTAYLKILMTTYFEGINNYESRRHCAVSSYNTGVGNVCLTVSGNKIVRNTVSIINDMTSSETYRYLSKNLKYKEAREYVVKVNDKYLMYKRILEYE